ncbi:MAG: FMN-binding protein [Paludibacter sp.]|nr:FMN-binding protein [Paludibacter sp.]
MKKITGIVILAIVLVICSLAMTGAKQFTDGVYRGESRSKYTAEPYWGQVTIEIKNDNVTLLSFQILDKEKNEVFGPDYERHFKDNPEYITQCRNEVKGIKAYTDAFLKTGTIGKIDAITGATWSYNIFRDALNTALDKARNK